MEVIGRSIGGWRVAQNTGQKIIFGYVETLEGTGGYIESSHPNDFVKLVSYENEYSAINKVISALIYEQSSSIELTQIHKNVKN